MMIDSERVPADQREPFFDPASSHMDLAIEPLGLISGPAALDLCDSGAAFALAGGAMAFTHARIGGDILTAVELRTHVMQAGMYGNDLLAHRLETLTRPRADFAGLPLAGAGPRIMGVCNVTPDSFSDGGTHDDPRAAISFARSLVAAGADMIDVGGESTRPGAEPVSLDVELARVLPVVSALAEAGIPVSIDTRHARVMAAAIGAGATIVNDVMALTGPDALATVAGSDASVVLMQMQGTPQTMQDGPAYRDVVSDVYGWLAERVAACSRAGIAPERMAVDPGFGFGKTVEHNTALLAHLGVFHGLGCVVAVGLSRKSFIGVLTGEEDPAARVSASVAAALAAVGQGAQIVRVHDVAETRSAFAIWRAQAGLAR